MIQYNNLMDKEKYHHLRATIQYKSILSLLLLLLLLLLFDFLVR